jgi:hypothetical protein
MIQFFMKSALLLCLLLSWNLVVAQETAKPEGILLRLRSEPGHVTNMKLTIIGNGEIAFEAPKTKEPVSPFCFSTSFPVDISLDLYMSESTVSVDEKGNITLDYTPYHMEMNLGLMRHCFSMNWNSDSVNFMMDNEPMGDNANMSQANRQMQLLKEPIRMVVSPRGKLLEMNYPFLEDTTMGGNPLGKLYTSFICNQNKDFFPENPVQVGDSWSTTTKLSLPEKATEFISISKTPTLITKYQVEAGDNTNGKKKLLLNMKSDCNFSNSTLKFGKLPMPENMPQAAIGDIFKNISIVLKKATFNQDGKINITPDNGYFYDGQSQTFVDIEVAVKMLLDKENNQEIKIKGSGKLLTKFETIN